MAKKPKFKPEITRIKLNPEQAVLVCQCYDDGKEYLGTDYYTSLPFHYHNCGPGKVSFPEGTCESSSSETGTPVFLFQSGTSTSS